MDRQYIREIAEEAYREHYSDTGIGKAVSVILCTDGELGVFPTHDAKPEKAYYGQTIAALESEGIYTYADWAYEFWDGEEKHDELFEEYFSEVWTEDINRLADEIETELEAIGK